MHNSWESLLWAHGPGATYLHLTPRKIAIGNLAVIISLRASAHASNLPPLIAQLLVVPVTDNTTSTTTNCTYKSAEVTAALPTAKILWYRRHYLPREADRADPEASPLLYPDGSNWARHAKDYARKLEEAGVPVELKVIMGMPHPFLAMDGTFLATCCVDFWSHSTKKQSHWIWRSRVLSLIPR